MTINNIISLSYGHGTHQEDYARLLLEGIDPNAVLYSDEAKRNVVVWGWRKGRRIQNRSGKNILVMERGYLGDREEWTSLGWNGLNGYANFHNKDVPSDRWVKYWKNGMKPWRGDDGDYVLVCGQVFNDTSLSDCRNYAHFLETRFIALLQMYGRVVYRPHPLSKWMHGLSIPSKVEVVDPLLTPLTHDMEKARLVVAWNSNSLVEAMYNGIPFESNSPGSMVHEYSMTDMDTEPDRETWGRRISYCQWNKEELSDGSAWRHIKVGAVSLEA